MFLLYFHSSLSHAKRFIFEASKRHTAKAKRERKIVNVRPVAEKSLLLNTNSFYFFQAPLSSHE